MITKEQAIDIVNKFGFFYGQRASRELWLDKPREVQDEDIINFNRDCENLLEYLKNTESLKMPPKTEAVINWIKEQFKDIPDGKAIIGISGGKDSTIAAALCVEALGADRVIGVLMPQGVQKDISDSYEVVATLKLQYHVVNIGAACEALYHSISDAVFLCGGKNAVESNSMITTNAPARIRMTALYAIAALYPNSRVVNTCNASEDYVGYSTKYGDAAGDFSPLGNLTVREVLEIGDDLGLPKHLVHKPPADGMCGKTDEDNLGFTYEQLDNYIEGKVYLVPDEAVTKIERLHKMTRHKYEPIPTFGKGDF